MRVIVFFDLPSVTHVDMKAYIKFRKFLLAEGFVMMQESVYSKITMNGIATNLIKEKLRKEKPEKGLVQVMAITEKQFASIEYLCGTSQTSVIDSKERLIIL